MCEYMLNTLLSSNMLLYTNALSLLDKHVCGAANGLAVQYAHVVYIFHW